MKVTTRSIVIDFTAPLFCVKSNKILLLDYEKKLFISRNLYYSDLERKRFASSYFLYTTVIYITIGESVRYVSEICCLNIRQGLQIHSYAISNFIHELCLILLLKT